MNVLINNVVTLCFLILLTTVATPYRRTAGNQQPGNFDSLKREPKGNGSLERSSIKPLPVTEVLVEYDDMEWHRREWISIFKDNLFHLFMVESSLVWSERQDPFSPSHGNILWPALNFIPLMSSVDLSSQILQPIEFLLDQELAFREPDSTQPFKEWDSKLQGVKDYPDVREAARRWMEAQDGQRILLTTPSVLVGFRVEVYRSEGTTQWYTAVICGYNEATHELTVTDDTVLEGHNEDPCLVQMRLIGDRVVESIMRGEDVGITPRRSRSSTAPMLPLVPQNVARFQKLQLLGVVNGSKQSEQTSAQAQSTRKHLRRPGAVQIIQASSPSPDDKGDGEARARSLRRRREIFVSDKDTRNKGRSKRIKGNGVDTPSNVTSKEDLENKGKKKLCTIGLRSAKKNVLEEANNSKLRRLVEVRVEDCLRRVKDNSVVGISVVSVDVPNVIDNSELSAEENTNKCDDDTDETPLTVTVIEEKEALVVTVEENIEDQEEEEEEELQEHLIEPKSEHQFKEGEEKPEKQQQPVEGEEQREEKEKDLPLTLPDDDDGPVSSSSPYSRMELAGDGSTTAALLRFPDDRSDSGVSSLRSGSCASGDERSGSRSSALSSSDEPTSQQTGTNNNSNCTSKPADIEVIENTDNKASTLDLQDSDQQSQQEEQVRVWRDPSLLLVAEPHVRHVHSVQHQSLLMSHPPGSASSAPPPPSAAPSPHYPPPPPLMSPHPLHLPPPASHHLYSQIPDMLWKQRYPPLPVGTHLHTAAEELLERERAYAQDRDRHDRLLRDRREQEVRELEKQKEREREREKVEREKQERERQERIEREKLEKQRAAEQAVHKHFEESLRLAHQKRMNTCWNILSSLPPPANRNSSGGGEVDVIPQNQQRLLAVDRDRLRQDRDRAYYTQSQTQSRPQNIGSKVEYPPPPAHSRVVGVKPPQSASTPAGHTNLPKAEPNFNLFGYPAYQPPLGFLPHDPNKIKGDIKISQSVQPSTPGATSISSLIVTKNSSVDREREMVLPNPPPLMSDLKNSVIVKNEVKTAVVENVKPAVLSHSQSPKLRVSEPHYLPPAPSNNNSQIKTSPFEYRSPSQSPHPLTHHHSSSPHPQYEAQNLASISKVHSVPPVHHRTRQSPHPPHRQSPHPPHRQSPHQPSLTQRQSPHHQHRQSPHAHVSSPDQRYASSTASLVYSKPATVGSYPYPSPAPPPPPPLHYAPTVTTPPKPKVSSPAPPHIYGKPTSGITTGTPVCRAQELRVSPLPLTSKAPLTPSPYQQLPQHQPPPPPHQVPSGVAPPPAHSSRSSVGIYDPRLYPPPGPGLAVSVKPPPSSPPSRSSPLHLNPGPNLAVTPAFQTQPLDLGVSSATKEEQDRPLSPKRKVDDMVCLEIKKRRIDEPVLSRVSEPSPLLASAATTITTVVNTAITEGVDRPKSASTPGTPAPPACPSPNTPAKPPSCIDSEKSNSPGPPPRPSYPVHKLKKAWLQRHSGEDGTDDKDVVGSGSCVTLPLSLPTNTAKKESESPSAVTSLHNIGSMAVNSISKSKPKVNRKSNKDPPLLNGHTSAKSHDADDSSSSDPERKSSPPKRIPPKVKRKKGGRKIVTDENKRKKLSASSTDSDKESGSEKESDSGKKVSGGQSDKSSKDNAKKRGRRPKTTQPALPKNEGGEEPRQKKPRDEPPTPPQRDPFAKPPVGQLKKSGESFLQDGPCFEVAPKLAKCRECRWTPNQRSRNMPNIFCRFYAFRRLRYTKNGQLAIAGFSDPHRDASQDDLKLWLPMPDNPPADLDLEMSRFLLTQVGDQFCDLLEQEKEAISVHMSDDKTIAWKRVVQGVREMCDVCETTLFNFHWACGKCGFVVCIDCYKGRKNGTIKMWGEPGRDRDDLSWLLCTNRQPHEQDRLMLTQIIAGDSLLTLGRRVHEARATWGIPMHCGCPLASQVKPTNGICKDLLKNLQCKNEPTINGQLKNDEEKDCGIGEKKTDDNNSTLSWLADVALSNEDKKPEESGSSSDSDEDRDGNYSTLRELLIRPSHKSNGSRAPSPGNNSNGSNGGGVGATTKATGNKKSHLDTLDEVISSVIEHSVQKECPEVPGKAPMQLKHFVRRYNWAQKGREPLPIRIMTLTESKMLYPDVPHSWLCDGKLLRLMDPNNSGNYRIFQDQWKRGQPVIVSDVTKHLNMGLWHPDSFARDFGETKNDLINCMTGNLVPNQPMRRFWEGFENFSKRLKDERGNHMLLKLKDWPPGEDFAEMLPSRFNDLMKVLPLGEYSQRSGRLNLASRLPDCFVRPDLGPKMYTAYGSALYATKGTTNLHLDISDAVNVMVYVGIPKDGDSEEHIKEAFRAIDEAGCDILTRRRVREKGELPGALWHIYTARDADKIRDLLNKVALERGARLEPHHDPIHDQSWYLDGPLRERLYKEYAVEGYAIVQCLGDAVFIPAGAPHQVRNLHNCIKVAEDFVSPENVSHCFHLTQEFRELSDTHSNHEDKLQIKNIIYHAVKDALSALGAAKENVTVPDIEQEMSIKQEDVTDS